MCKLPTLITNIQDDISGKDNDKYSQEELLEKLRFMEMEKEILRKQLEQATAKHQETMLLCMNYISLGSTNSILPSLIIKQRLMMLSNLKNQEVGHFP
jgi:hypothetical protein